MSWSMNDYPDSMKNLVGPIRKKRQQIAPNQKAQLIIHRQDGSIEKQQNYAM
jgi:uncharacterized protein YdaT